MFVCDAEAQTIRKIEPSGTNWVVTTIAGSSGQYGSVDGTNGDARFFAPFGIAVDANENVFVADAENCTIRKIVQVGTNWVVTTIAGSPLVQGYADGTNNASLLSFPYALRVDKAGNIFVADTETDTIRYLYQSGTNWVTQTLIGLPWRWGYADGTGTHAQFDTVSGLAIDDYGNVFLADLGNQVIRLIIPPPVPSITLSENQIVLTWPLWATNFSLMKCLSLPSGLWSAVTNEPIISGNSISISNPINSNSAFYRLTGQ